MILVLNILFVGLLIEKKIRRKKNDSKDLTEDEKGKLTQTCKG